MFISEIQKCSSLKFISEIQKCSAVACTVAALCFTLLYMNSRRRRRRVDVEWRNLPADILLLIAEHSEIRHLRAVCSSWRSSLPLPYKPHHPLRSAKIPLPFDRDHHLRRDDLSVPSYLTLTVHNIYCLEPLGNIDDSPESCWIVKLEKMSSGKMRFHNPLAYWSIPSSRLNLPTVVDFLDCRVILVGKEYTLRGRYVYPICRVVLSDDAMLCLFDFTKLGYFKFGDECWTMIVDEGKDELSHVSTDDIIYHKQKFYVIYSTGRIIVFDSSLKVEVFVSTGAPVDQGYQLNEWFFVQSDADLFVVYKYDVWNVDARSAGYRTLHFKVYRLNSDEQQWNEVTNLSDQSFFIGYDGCAFSIGFGQFSGCGKNLIYCADRTFDIPDSNEPWYNIGIFSLEDNSSRPLHRISSRYSRLFWPIPSWLKQGGKLRNAGLRRFLFK